MIISGGSVPGTDNKQINTLPIDDTLVPSGGTAKVSLTVPALSIAGLTVLVYYHTTRTCNVPRLHCAGFLGGDTAELLLKVGRIYLYYCLHYGPRQWRIKDA